MLLSYNTILYDIHWLVAMTAAPNAGDVQIQRGDLCKTHFMRANKTGTMLWVWGTAACIQKRPLKAKIFLQLSSASTHDVTPVTCVQGRSPADHASSTIRQSRSCTASLCLPSRIPSWSSQDDSNMRLLAIVASWSNPSSLDAGHLWWRKQHHDQYQQRISMQCRSSMVIQTASWSTPTAPL